MSNQYFITFPQVVVHFYDKNILGILLNLKTFFEKEGINLTRMRKISYGNTIFIQKEIIQ